MPALRTYRQISRFGGLSYRAKIMVVAFLGTHIPLIALAGYFGLQLANNWAEALDVMLVTLAATLIGTAMTLLALNGLLQPILFAASRLRRYREGRIAPDLPTEFDDEAGTLMADAQETMTQLEQVLVTLETRDPGTGLPNRTAFVDALEAEHDGAVAVVRLLSHGELAELFDFNAAEAAMGQLVDRLTGSGLVGPGLARVGTAELAFVLRVDVRDENSCIRAAFALKAILAAVGGEMQVEGRALLPDMRGGLARLTDGLGRDAVLANALSAMSDATDTEPVGVFSEGKREEARERFAIVNDLRRAMEDEQFTLNYQPIFDRDKNRVTGVEALLRWTCPTRGAVSPGIFIPIAEASGLIDEIGLWVLRRACHDAAEMPQNLRVAVNLSARQFADPELAAHIQDALDNSGLDPDRLELELTETAALADPAHTRRTMMLLREMGVRMAIDDFGTGYASLSALRSLPFSKLKIDREFVTGVEDAPGSQAICSAMIALANGLDIEVLAEGTETPGEVAWLADAGCHLFQGFHFARPVTAEVLPETIAALQSGDLSAQVA